MHNTWLGSDIIDRISGIIDRMKEKLFGNPEPELREGRFRISKEKSTYHIKNYNNEPIVFVDNWDLTHFEELSITQDNQNTKITLPNKQVIIIQNRQADSFTDKNFDSVNIGVGYRDGMPRKLYTGTEGDDSYRGVWSVGSTLKGLGGNDHLLGGQEKDTIYGGDGDDTIDGKEGDDRLEGNAGNDHIWGDAGKDNIFGGDGDDILDGGPGDDVIDGGPGNDVIAGGWGNNTLTGGSGSDTFVIPIRKGQKDTIRDFDPRTDILNLEGQSVPFAFEHLTFVEVGPNICVNLLDGQTVIMENIKKGILRAQHFRLNGNPIPQAYYEGTQGDDIHHGFDNIRNIIGGGPGNDRLTGKNLADTILGDEGADLIIAGDGDDLVYGGSGNDTIGGGNGNDRLSGGEGIDLICGEEGHDTILGNEGDDSLQGGNGDDTIDGGAGNDHIRGDRGNNTLIGGSGIDCFIIASRPGEQDTIVDYDPTQEKIYFDNSSISSFSQLRLQQKDTNTYLDLSHQQTLLLKNVAPSDLKADLFIFDPSQMVGQHYFGTEEKDYIVGLKIFSNIISGVGGADILWGGDYKDIISGGEGDDKLEGEDGNDFIFGGAGNDEIKGGPGDDTLYADEGDNWLVGGEGNDTLSSGPGRNALFGDTGHDILHIMGPGQFTGGPGKDIFKVHVPASLTIPPQTSPSRPCLVGDISKPYQKVVITDFDIAEEGEKIDLSSFSEVTSLESLTITETEVSRNNRDPGLCFNLDGRLIVIKDYQKLRPAPLLTLSIKEATPRVLVEIYNVKKRDLTADHFIFHTPSRSPRSVEYLEAEDETTRQPNHLAPLNLEEPLMLLEDVHASPAVMLLEDFMAL